MKTLSDTDDNLLDSSEGNYNKRRKGISESAVLQFVLATGGTMEEAQLSILSGLAKGTIRPSPKVHTVSEKAIRAFLEVCGETSETIDKSLAERRAYESARSEILKLRRKLDFLQS